MFVGCIICCFGFVGRWVGLVDCWYLVVLRRGLVWMFMVVRLFFWFVYLLFCGLFSDYLLFYGFALFWGGVCFDFCVYWLFC